VFVYCGFIFFFKLTKKEEKKMKGKMQQTKTELRAEWLVGHKAMINNAKTPEEGSSKNAFFRRGMSCGGWGYWVWALNRAGIQCGAQSYWSGSAPTPSTAINKGIADYISENCPIDIR
jgi:hypothetical protein